jgi:hypothetical protein
MSTNPGLPPIAALLAELGWTRGLARSLVYESDDAEDLAQDAMLASLRRPPSDDGPLRPWLATVVRNLWRSRIRGNRRRGARELVGHDGETPPTPEESMVRMEEHAGPCRAGGPARRALPADGGAALLRGAVGGGDRPQPRRPGWHRALAAQGGPGQAAGGPGCAPPRPPGGLGGPAGAPWPRRPRAGAGGARGDGGAHLVRCWRGGGGRGRGDRRPQEARPAGRSGRTCGERGAAVVDASGAAVGAPAGLRGACADQPRRVPPAPAEGRRRRPRGRDPAAGRPAAAGPLRARRPQPQGRGRHPGRARARAGARPRSRRRLHLRVPQLRLPAGLVAAGRAGPGTRASSPPSTVRSSTAHAPSRPPATPSRR